jgi:CBS-domain-containing membrane protein
MVTRPTVHRSTATVAQLRAFFEDDHVHMALIVENGTLLGVIERDDLATAATEEASAREIARLDARTIQPDAALQDARARMTREHRRRLAVTADQSALVGLLCLKANGRGFCSDQDVTARRLPQSRHGGRCADGLLRSLLTMSTTALARLLEQQAGLRPHVLQQEHDAG